MQKGIVKVLFVHPCCYISLSFKLISIQCFFVSYLYRVSCICVVLQFSSAKKNPRFFIRSSGPKILGCHRTIKCGLWTITSGRSRPSKCSFAVQGFSSWFLYILIIYIHRYWIRTFETFLFWVWELFVLVYTSMLYCTFSAHFIRCDVDVNDVRAYHMWSPLLSTTISE